MGHIRARDDKKMPDFTALMELARPHIDSFDYFIDRGLDVLVSHVKPIEVNDSSSATTLRIWLENPVLLPPDKEGNSRIKHEQLLPYECRQCGTSYRGRLHVDVCFQYNGGVVIREQFFFGRLPVMLKSKLCHLRGADSKKLVSLKEESTEIGGYFICNGLERLARILIMPKRNYPLGVIRNAYRNRGPAYTEKAVVIRCVRQDQSAITVRMYYLQHGSASIGFLVRKKEYIIPVGIMLKALIDTSDAEIYTSLTSSGNGAYHVSRGAGCMQLIGERAKIILNEVGDFGLFTRLQCLQFIGKRFQPIMEGLETESHSTVGESVLKEFVFVHLDSNHDKFNLLIFMLQKLFAIVDRIAAPDNLDTTQNHEVLLPGQLITVYLKEKFEEWLRRSKSQILEELRNEDKHFDVQNLLHVKKSMDKFSAGHVAKAVEAMLSTGNIVSSSGLDMQQVSGMTVVAERLNFLRFMSHFRSIHRGSFFVQMRTTSVRKLLPESWGFLCPVHTPDGPLCGLLSHMTSTCRITSYFDAQGNIKDFSKIRMSILSALFCCGMTPQLPRFEKAGAHKVLNVLLDGCVIGTINANKVMETVAYVRNLKTLVNSAIPDDLEVGYVPLSFGGAYPGLFLFTSPSRFIRPVKNLGQGGIEFIGPFEQAFMEIRCPDGRYGGSRLSSFSATHEEVHPTAMLSVVANLTPWSDHNQSPRNMYQCQMAKQTMGFSSQSLQFRADNKTYHLLTPQSPIVRTSSYNKYCVDEFPAGTNAIVAVLAYSGYDMEDAMILNKSSVERGLCRAHIYQLETVDLTDTRGRQDHAPKLFARNNNDKSVKMLIDSDGLPYIGQVINPDEAYYSTYNTVTNKTQPAKLKGSEAVIVDYVVADGASSKKHLQRVNIRLRRPRKPEIGDKFSSRHGQKGVCSQLWPDVDMPFSGVTGMRPDLIINPHAFPSRMTIAMLLESIAAKAGSLKGTFVDATPFSGLLKQVDGGKPVPSTPIEEYGPLLASYGFNYHGTEVLYSGVLGTELTCEIFIGPVYYQRLRHMVSDKFQVRSTGPINHQTRQPLKGRKIGGGIRFGEMERDSILAHGASYLLHDRLHTCSDYHIADVCSLCGSLLTASIVQPKKITEKPLAELSPAISYSKKTFCQACQSSKGMETVAMPFVFRYLAAELAAMNIKVALNLRDQL
ncbi:unnamed protein product [Victoria cruziana]